MSNECSCIDTPSYLSLITSSASIISGMCSLSNCHSRRCWLPVIKAMSADTISQLRIPSPKSKKLTAEVVLKYMTTYTKEEHDQLKVRPNLELSLLPIHWPIQHSIRQSINLLDLTVSWTKQNPIQKQRFITEVCFSSLNLCQFSPFPL